MVFSKGEYVLSYSDGTVTNISFSLDASKQTVSDGITGMLIERIGNEFTVHLAPIEAKPLRYLDAELYYPEAFMRGELRMYYNSYTTNDIACVMTLPEGGNIDTRDIVLLHHVESGKTIGAAFTGVDRFWTYIKARRDKVIMRHWMEDKPLVDGAEYRLEPMTVSEGTPQEQLKAYADCMMARYPRKKKETPTGWCSWSCYYRNVDEEKILRANRELDEFYGDFKTNLVQIDDGWQQGNTFCGTWLEDREKFPNGLKAVAEACHKSGRTFGLWIAPLLACEDGELFEKHPELKKVLHRDGEPDEGYRFVDTPVYALDLDQEAAYEHLREVFKRCKEEYGSEYFKLDFLFPAVYKLASREYLMSYQTDYLSAMYRKAMQTVRDTVGEDVFLLACGAPFAESLGIFDGTRIAADITWGKSKNHPTQWELICMCAKSTFYRSFTNQTMFINDADGLVVRDYDEDDGYDCTYHEARTWATAVAMSGGALLINEQMAKIGSKRREMFEKMLPALDVAAQPVDFFDLTLSQTYIPLEGGSVLVAMYNWGEKMADMKLELDKVGIHGDAVVLRTWNNRLEGVVSGEVMLHDMMPHSAEVLCITPVGDEPSFAFAENNLFGGAGIYSASQENGVLTVTASEKLAECKNHTYYLFVPNGYELADGECAMQTARGKLVRMTAVPGERKAFTFTKA